MPSNDASGHATPEWVDRRAYPFASRRLRLAGGESIHYVDEGSGPPLLFVHGTPTWSFEWRHLIGGLSERYRCIAPDHLGFGLSDRPPKASYTPEAHAARLVDFVDRLEVSDLTLVLHDFGGPIGLPLALERGSRVRRLILFNSWMWSFIGDPKMESNARKAGGALGRWLYRHVNFSLRVLTPYAWADRGKLTSDIHRQYLEPFRDKWAREAVLWALARALLGSSEFYDSLWRRRDALRRLPALIIWGTADPAFRVELLARWRETLPQARVVELPVGHWPQEEAPDAVTAAIRQFLSATS